MNEWASTPAMTPAELAERVEAAKELLQKRGGFTDPGGLGWSPTASTMPASRPWDRPSYKRPEDPRKPDKLKKPPGVKMLLQLKKRLDEDYIPIHERPDFAKEAALQALGIRHQDKEVLMDQTSDHDAPSEVGSSGRSMHSGSTRCSRAELQLEAVQNYPAIDSETPSERHD